MLLEISTTHYPATDLGYLLHKHPGRAQSFDLAFGRAHVYYPEATHERTTAALLLDVDPVGLVRGGGHTLDQYVNDRPYVASSLLSTAISRVYGTALGGRCKDRPDLVGSTIPLEARLPTLPCRGGDVLLRRLFEPLGYEVSAEAHALDPAFPDWGRSPYYSVTLTATKRLRDLLTHLYVLVPVLDSAKHYWVGEEEVEKLLAKGEGWLAQHPERELITRRYLKFQRGLANDALARLAVGEEPDEEVEEHDREEEAVERPIRLNQQRLETVAAMLKASGARRVLDLGCGEGKLIRVLLKERQFEEVVGMDVSHRALERARERLRLDEAGPRLRERVSLVHGSLMYRDRRLTGFDAAAVVEVIEHLDAHRLEAFERAVFADARPGTVIVTTPNREYNVLFESLPAGRFRHADHRFEWTRAEFAQWAERIAEGYGYAVRFAPVGEEHPEYGAPTQLAVLTRVDNAL